MKVRSGFVSNSSSSSFVALVVKDKFDKIKEQVAPLGEAVMKQLDIRNVKFLGKDCVLYECSHGNYGFMEYINVNNVTEDALRIARERELEFELGEDMRSDIQDIEAMIEAKIRWVANNSDDAIIHTMDF